jgi:adenylate cyclase
MPLKDDLINKINSYFKEPYEVEETTIVPSTDYSKLTFGNKGLTSDFAFLFVDIRKSSNLHELFGYKNAAKIYQSFHEINVNVINHNDGKVRAFDGDRTMGVFSGNSKNNNAVKAAMQINWAIRNILNPILSSHVSCGIGIDYGKILITKVGKGRNIENNDLIWVGQACNHASHLSNEAGNSIIISERTYNVLNDSRKLSNGINIWKLKRLTLKNNSQINCYETSYQWDVTE